MTGVAADPSRTTIHANQKCESTTRSTNNNNVSLQITILAVFLSCIVGYSLGQKVVKDQTFRQNIVAASTTTSTSSPKVPPQEERQLDRHQFEKYELLVHPALIALDIEDEDDDEEEEDEDDTDDDPPTVRVAIWTDAIEPVLEILKYPFVTHVLVIGIDHNNFLSNHHLSKKENNNVCPWSDEQQDHSTSCWNVDARVHFQNVTNEPKSSCDEIMATSNHHTAATAFDVILVDGESFIGKMVLANHSKLLVQCLETGMVPLDLDRGMLVVQVPGYPTAEIIYPLERYGFDSIISFDYKFRSETLSTIIAMKDWETRTHWFSNEAEIAYRITKRFRNKSKNDDASDDSATIFPYFQHFDTITMLIHQQPSRLAEDVWCRSNRMVCQNAGHGFDPNIPNVPVSLFQVQRSSVVPGEYGSRGVFTTVLIPPESYITLEEHVNDVFFPSKTLNLAIHMANTYGVVYEIPMYVDGYGWEMDHHGDTSAFVDASIMMFANHGCNDTHNLFSKSDPPVGAFSPFFERRWKILESIDLSRKTLVPGDEILSNYLEFVEESETAKYNDYITSLCRGTAIGEVAEYEQSEMTRRDETNPSIAS